MVAVVLLQLLLKTCNSCKILSTEKHPGNGMLFYLGVLRLAMMAFLKPHKKEKGFRVREAFG
jgi:hypothetical protein